ncbi:MAG TPA: FAD-dependent oxidoreductase [Mycobacteriales bacterium]|nr:FAD-dependent oxidoreductase [Mycobacteriales bacterium]
MPSSGASGPVGDGGRVVVVGAGMAGTRTCQELRARGYPGELVLLGAEPHPPYDRPPLSKAFLLAAPGHTDLALDPQWYAGADWRPGVTATGLRPGVLDTTDGELGWDALVLATGAAPARLAGTGGGPGGRVLRTLDDAERLRDGLTPGARVVVVGAGWIGAEVTTAARRRGCEVTVLEAGDAPLVVPLGSAVGGHTAAWYAQAGATLRCGTPVSTVDGDGVTLAGGERLAADVVVEAVGVRRELDWLSGSGVQVDHGVLTDASCRTSLAGVVAVGDCAARWSPRAGRRFRLEHWDDALNAPGVAARVLLGDRAAVYDPVPYVWSEQFGRYLQWVGWRDGEPRVWRADPAARAGWAAAWLDPDGRLTGFLAVDRPRDLLQARRVIAEGRAVDPDRLADPAIPVKEA